MANRYWVPSATPFWDQTTTSSWSASSGGSGGASVPTSSDDVFFDANSGASTVNITNGTCRNLTFSGFTGSIGWVSQPGSLDLYGNLTLASSMGSFIVNALNLLGTGTITSNGIYIDATNTSLNTTGSYSLNSACDFSSDLNIVKGSLSTNNYNVTANQLIVSTSETCSLTCGASTINAVILFNSGLNFTFNAGTSTIIGAIINTYSTPRTFYNATFSSNSNQVIGTNTFNNITITTNRIIFGGTTTVNGVLTVSAGTTTTPKVWTSSNRGTQATVSINSTSGTFSYYWFEDINVTGVAAPITGTFLNNMLNNSGITFPAPKNVYWVGGSGTWGSTNAWALSSGGSPSTSNYPLAQDTVIFDDNSGVSGFQVTVATPASILVTSINDQRLIPMTLFFGRDSWMYFLGDIVFTSFITINQTSTSNVTNTFILYGRSAQNISLGTTAVPFTIANNGNVVSLAGDTTINAGSASGLVNFAVNHLYGTLNCSTYTLTINGTTRARYDVINLIAGPYIGSSSSQAIIDFHTAGTKLINTLRWRVVNGKSVTITDTGTIRARANFDGGNGVQYPTVDIGSTSVTFTGSGTFKNITNSYKSTGATTVRFTSGTVNSFISFDLAGEASRICTLTSTLTSSKAGLVLTSGAPINAGSTSTDAGNNSGVLFTGAGPSGYLSVSYINSNISQSSFLLF